MSKLQELQDEVAIWSIKTFGSSRPPSAPLNHLIKEVKEVIDAPHDRMEFADCFLLILDAASKAGINTEQLLTAAFKKLEINKKRQWGEPNKNGVVEHIK